MSETIRLIAADSARAFPGGDLRGQLGEGDLATWELRGLLAAALGEKPRIDIDGGQRVDLEGGDSRWIVGAGPGSSLSWEKLAGRMVDALREAYAATELEAAERAAAWVSEGQPIDEVRVEIRALVALRARGERGSLETQALSSSELRIRWEEPTGPRTLTLPLASGEPVPPRPRPTASPSPTTFATVQAGDYRVILSPEAAAYCLHELAHAALERGVAPLGGAARGPGPALLEDPAGAPFPYGFERDDLGCPASASTLWSSAGRHALPAGHARRSSLAATPRPALSFTRLVDTARAPLLDEGPSLRADAVSAARYDPALDRIFLAVRSFDLLRSGEPPRTLGGGVLSVSADEAWQGLAEVDGEGRQRLVRARCTRLGCVHPVMVGAPTIALRSMQYLPEFPLQQRESG